MTNENEGLLDLLNSCIEKVNEKVKELSVSMLAKGEKLDDAKQTVGDILSHIHQLTDTVTFLYSQIENMEHRIECNEKFKKLDYDPSYKFRQPKGDSND